MAEEVKTDWWHQVPRKFVRSLTTPYVTAEGLKALDQYQYHSSQCTIFDDWLNKNFWTPLSFYVPRCIHPNVLTGVALLCSVLLGYIPLAIYSSDFYTAAPAWVYACSAVGWFLYQTLDALDGKQARRTGLSSPMGQMMDHGCDSLTTFFAAFILMTLPRTGVSLLNISTMIFITFELFYYSWFEYKFGEFRSCTGKYCGVSEGQLAICLMSLVTMVFPDFILLPISALAPSFLRPLVHLLTFGMQLNTFAMIFVNILLWSLIHEDVSDLIKSKRLKDMSMKYEAMKEWAVFLSQCWFNVAFMLCPIREAYPLTTCMIIAFYSSLTVWRCILSIVTKSKLRLFEWTSAPYYLCAMLMTTGALRRLPILEGFVMTLSVVWGIIAWTLFVHINMDCVKRYLNKPLWVVPAETLNETVKEATKETAKETAKETTVEAIKSAETTAETATETAVETTNTDGKETVEAEETAKIPATAVGANEVIRADVETSTTEQSHPAEQTETLKETGKETTEETVVTPLKTVAGTQVNVSPTSMGESSRQISGDEIEEQS